MKSMNYSKDNIFYKIIHGYAPTKIILEDEKFIAFPDVKPQAHKHILCVPKFEYVNFTHMMDSEPELVVDAAKFIMQIIHVEEIKTYRLLTNCGEHAGQSVMHLHWHILSNDNSPTPLSSGL